MKFSVQYLSAIILALSATYSLAETKIVSSPDGHIVVGINDDAGLLTYAVQYRGEDVIKKSELGLEFKNINGFVRNLHIVKYEVTASNTNWQQPWGERKKVTDNHKELVLKIAQKTKPFHYFNLHVKVFNDGIGFRYEVPTQLGLAQVDIVDEKTEFYIPDSDKVIAYWIPGRAPRIDEYLYNTTTLTQMTRAQTPATFKLASGTHISIHEAALIDYAAYTLEPKQPGHLKADLTPWYDGVRVKTQTPFVTPWRSIQIAPNAIGLLNSDLILNLNEPNKLGDVSWVKPGKYIGIWWGMHLNAMSWGMSDKHGATTARTKAYMDFAAQYGFSGVLVEGWNLGWDDDWVNAGEKFNFTTSYPDFDLAEITRYGKTKGVNLIGHHETAAAVTNYRNQMADAFDLYQKVGVTQVKTGYVNEHDRMKRIDENGIERMEWHDGQFAVNEYMRSVTEAAKRHISIDSHEPIKDTGLRRTYPNWVTREAARGQEYNAPWSTAPNTPEHTVLLAFTRMLSGPMDYTPGIFNLTPLGINAEARIKNTLAKELALYVVLYSPIQMAADLLENYFEKDGTTLKPGFQFIRDMTTDWEESIALAGEVGDYVAYARKKRDGNEWFLGAITDENPRKLSLKLSFLDANKKYAAEIYRDGPTADWKTNPYDLLIEKKTVTAKDVMDLSLASSGGLAVRFKPVK
jgi:alpha-glucosidase